MLNIGQELTLNDDILNHILLVKCMTYPDKIDVILLINYTVYAFYIPVYVCSHHSFIHVTFDKTLCNSVTIMCSWLCCFLIHLYQLQANIFFFSFTAAKPRVWRVICI